MVQAAITPDPAGIKQLANVARAQSEKSLKQIRILNLQNLAHVALHIGRNVGIIPKDRVDPRVENGWISMATGDQTLLSLPGL